ncbi:Putative GTP cyclohydrolase 1 type 2 [Candidatus Westeberhardia cardiocondylae]|uniref:Putative GTP cyclohydrolase 1 type 2 n=1 Tax=Candidatus Westeberhardia cardiocondylae TaxID=1594731 RepID=A0A0H5BX58_9ENTR|nr:Nif3-like dinuclear metal center hexameric protein [Candidatus Westeberhardia cardiocondylae]CEN32194.1 Putative GTP cyclohydrolase 1 type 2 [Candidatus Westeberhardia cardiocondylae]
MLNVDLEFLVNQKIDGNQHDDYAPNGLQVEGRRNIQNIVTGVTFCKKLIDIAVKCNADAIIVHHGCFWKNDSPVITGIKYKRLQALLTNNINLYAWHFPLDIHPELGNNAQLAKRLKIKKISLLGKFVMQGELSIPSHGIAFNKNIKEALHCYHVWHFFERAPSIIKKIAWCTGKGQNFIKLAIQNNLDAFISGEVSEETMHLAKEGRIHFYSVGHYATERVGIQALGKWLMKKYNLNVIFIDIPNPI